MDIRSAKMQIFSALAVIVAVALGAANSLAIPLDSRDMARAAAPHHHSTCLRVDSHPAASAHLIRRGRKKTNRRPARPRVKKQGFPSQWEPQIVRFQPPPVRDTVSQDTPLPHARKPGFHLHREPQNAPLQAPPARDPVSQDTPPPRERKPGFHSHREPQNVPLLAPPARDPVPQDVTSQISILKKAVADAVVQSERAPYSGSKAPAATQEKATVAQPDAMTGVPADSKAEADRARDLYRMVNANSPGNLVVTGRDGARSVYMRWTRVPTPEELPAPAKLATVKYHMLEKQPGIAKDWTQVPTKEAVEFWREAYTKKLQEAERDAVPASVAKFMSPAELGENFILI